MGMSYRVDIDPKAEKAIARIARRDQVRIFKAIAALADDPRPHGVTKLSGFDGYRIRVGDYRIVYTIDDEVRIVNVTNVGNRDKIYRRLR